MNKLYVLMSLSDESNGNVLGIYDSMKECELVKQREINKEKLQFMSYRSKPIKDEYDAEIFNRCMKNIKDRYFIETIEINKFYKDNIN